MSKVEQIEAELQKLTPKELREIRDWMDDLMEDELAFTPEFEAQIQQSEKEMQSGKSSRIRKPDPAA